MGIAKTPPLRREVIHRGRLYDGMSRAALSVKTLVVGKEKQKVRAALLSRRRGDHKAPG